MAAAAGGGVQQRDADLVPLTEAVRRAPGGWLVERLATIPLVFPGLVLHTFQAPGSQ